MTTPEQQAREMLGEATSSDLPVLVADIIAERDALKAELDAIKQGAGEPVACLIRHRHARARAHAAIDGRNHYSDWSSWEPARLSYGLAVTRPSRVYPDSEPIFEIKPLYTRPAVPLMDEKVKELICEHFVTGENLFNEVHQDYRFRSLGTATNVWGADLLKFARALEAAHNIKGAKP